MINNISISNFKSLRDCSARISRINLLTGANGRGKSSFLQVLLLLSQSWRKGESLSLCPYGEWKNLGGYEDIHNVYHTEDTIDIKFSTDIDHEKELDLSYKQDKDNPVLGILDSFKVDGKKIATVMTDDMMSADDDDDVVEEIEISAKVSDFITLNQLKRIFYISSDRIAAQHSEAYSSSAMTLSPNGANVVNVYHKQSDETKQEIQQRLSYVFEGAMIRVEPKDANLILTLNSSEDTHLYSPENVGYGYSYALQLILANVLIKSGDTMIVENPEAHLHPSAQARLMKMLIRDAKSKGYQLFVETHSDHVINTTLLEIKREDSPCTLDDVEILFFSNYRDENEHVSAKSENLNITSMGQISNPPEDFCSQYAMDLEELYQ